MALQITEQPSYIAPTGNPMIFKVEDTNPEVRFFRATIYEVGTSRVLGTMKVFKTPTGDGNFVDVSSRLKDYSSIEVDNSSSIVESVDGAINYYIVFESVDDAGNTLPNGTLTTSNKWAMNGGGDVLNGYSYDVTDWYMSISQIGVKFADFLTKKPSISKIFIFQKEFLYFLADSTSGITEARITVYKEDNSVVGTYTEPIVLSPSDGILHRLYLQPNLLATNYEFEVTDVHRIEVALYGADGVRVSKIRQYIIDEAYNCSVDKVNILWENYEGGIDTYTFINPRETKNVTRQTMTLNGYSEPVNNVYESLSSVVYTSVESTYRLTTLGLTDEMYRSLSNMIGTHNAYVELGDGSLWSIILDNTSVEVKRRKYENSLLRFDLQFKSLPNLDLINRGEVLIEEDRMPNPLNFIDEVDAEFETQYTSNSQIISGINVTVPVSVTNGEYRINSGVWTNQPSIANNGDTVTLRTTTALASLNTKTVVLNVGDGVFQWKVTTKEIKNIPDTVVFDPQNDVDLNTNIDSNTVVITNINVPIVISVANGSYSKNGGAFTTAQGTAVNGDTIRLRQVSANASLTSKTTTFNYGSKTATFVVKTREYDVIPDDFTFTNVTNAPLNSEQLSNTITVNGITDPVNISISAGQYRINGGSWVATSGTVVNGDTVQLRLVAPANAGQSVSTTLTIGTKSASWTVDTTAPDITPNPFTFNSQSGVANNTYISSNIVTISGINVGSPISITSGSSYAQYRINGGAWTSANGTVFNGNTVQMRILSAVEWETTRTAVLNIGGVTGSFSVTTPNAPSVTVQLCHKVISPFEIEIQAQLFHSPSATLTTQNIALNGEYRYRDDNNQLRSGYFSFMINSGSNYGSTWVYPDYTLNSSNPLIALFGVYSNPSNGSNVNTQAGARKLIVPNNHDSFCP